VSERVDESGRVRGRRGFLGHVVRPLWYLGNNRLSAFGVALATSSAITLIVFFAGDLVGLHVGPYTGIIVFLILPAFFLLGLLLIPIGIWLRRRDHVRRGILPTEFPPVDPRDPRTRETVAFVGILTGVNLLILLAAAYRGVEHMDSVDFCGRTCHTVMQPEHTAYQNTAHARVPCVDCHIGPGASWFVRSKLSGSWQLIAVTFDLYPRPIPTPIHNLRPSRETCEQCHWPDKFSGQKLVVRTHYTDDEVAEPRKNVLLVHTGGLDPLSGRPIGIHGVHMQPGAEIQYLPGDERRQTIPYVRYARRPGDVVEFRAGDFTGNVDESTLRRMDCVDCHNRPSHRFELPRPALDAAMAAGLIDPSLPFVKREALRLLEAEYPDRDAAARRIRAGLPAFYAEHYPARAAADRERIAAAADAVADIYRRNVFPAMRVGWGTYPDNLGHESFPGCFRCHGGDHTSATGDMITFDCDACHKLLATDDPDPDILKTIATR
jgi:hypothetical protein